MTDTIKDFLVPDLGEGLQEATLTEWNVGVGDNVNLNQVVCTLETAKAQVEIPSPYGGRIAEICGGPGDMLAVGSLLLRIDTAPADTAPIDRRNGAVRTPVLVGYGADNDFDVSRRAESAPAEPSEPVDTGVGAAARPRAKPAVRRLAAQLLVDLTELAPGPDGLISRESVLAAAGVHGAQRHGITHDVLPVRGVHAEMARRMTLSRSVIPDAHASVEVDCGRLIAVRDRLRLAAGDTAEQITTFALTLRLVVLALTHHRLLNATWADDADGPQIRVHHAVHLGVGVAAPRGLLVPVVFDAQTKSMRELAGELARLIGAARDGVLKPAELSGSTFTVSNFGALGLDAGVPVINHPEAAILGMGSVKARAVVVDGSVVAHPTMTLTCAFDHRVADGAQVAAFLGEVRDLIEAPELALLDL